MKINKPNRLEILIEENHDKFRNTGGGLYNFCHFLLSQAFKEVMIDEETMIKEFAKQGSKDKSESAFAKGFNRAIDQLQDNIKSFMEE